MKDSPGYEQPRPKVAVSRRSRRASGEASASSAEAPEDMDHSEAQNEADPGAQPTKRQRFRNWRHRRPFAGSVLVILGAIELFFSGQLDTGNLQIQFGIEGLQATVIPIALAVLALCAMLKPTHYLFYGIIALVLAVYSLIGVNLGGFLLGMLLSTIGSILIVAWMGPRKPKAKKSKSKKSKAKADIPTAEGETE